MGILDVVLAFGLAVLLLALYGLGQSAVTDPDRLISYRAYRWLASLFVDGLVLFFLAGNRIRWDVLLPG
jgi:hypothetical protein